MLVLLEAEADLGGANGAKVRLRWGGQNMVWPPFQKVGGGLTLDSIPQQSFYKVFFWPLLAPPFQNGWIRP